MGLPEGVNYNAAPMKDYAEYPKVTKNFNGVIRPKKGSQPHISHNHIRFNTNFVGFKLN